MNNNAEVLKMLEIAFAIMAAWSFMLEKCYKNFVNCDQFEDDQFPERGCSMFFYIMLVLIGGIELSRSFYVFGSCMLIWGIYGIYMEITSRIPYEIKIDAMVKSGKPIYGACGRLLWQGSKKST